ncbi:MAG: hypothetical protein KBE23_13915 [Chloroflexi bacterium]|nr:hypothetical protein [Chloroflexota bacterium]MBP7043837.1 hypothetical protein [Chloroflexota bacterium]
MAAPAVVTEAGTFVGTAADTGVQVGFGVCVGLAVSVGNLVGRVSPQRRQGGLNGLLTPAYG